MSNSDLNICFFSGKIISKPEFNFFYNSKKFVSKVSFEIIKIVTYNENADYIYKNLNIGDKMEIQGFLHKDNVILENAIFIKDDIEKANTTT